MRVFTRPGCFIPPSERVSGTDWILGLVAPRGGLEVLFPPAFEPLFVQPIVHGTFNRLKPAGHVMHHQFNIQQLYALPTLYLCVLYLSENKQRLVPLTA